MKKKSAASHIHLRGHVIQLGILVFWTFFWLFNVIDKFIGGPGFLFVGRDRFAQIVKFFSSLGIENPNYALGSLIFATLLEVAALVLVGVALFHLLKGNNHRARTLYFWGTFAGLALFSFFAIGDQIFGDRFELLEHTLFWIAIIASWGAYVYFPKEELDITKRLNRKVSKALIIAAVVILLLGISVVITQVNFNAKEFQKRTQIVEPINLGQGIFSFELPFLSNRAVWEQSLSKFIEENPQLRITAIYTIPSELESKADNVIIWVITENRSYS